MAKEFARKFYHSKSWKATRQAYFSKQHGLCERCYRRGIMKPGAIVHHKLHLTPANIDNPNVTLSFANLELLCRDCHAEEHADEYGKDGRIEPRVAFDEYGNVVRLGVDNGNQGEAGQAGEERA